MTVCLTWGEWVFWHYGPSWEWFIFGKWLETLAEKFGVPVCGQVL